MNKNPEYSKTNNQKPFPAELTDIYVPEEVRLKMREETVIALSAAWRGSRAIRSTSVELVSEKGNNDFLTNADLASEKVILEHIKNSFTGDPILSEESSPDLNSPLEKDRLWIVDPIDGTNNAKEGRRGNYVTCVGYMEKGQLQAVAVVNPDTEEVWFAQKGLGTYYNGVKTHVRSDKELSKSYIGIDPYFSPDIREAILRSLLDIIPIPWSTNFGSAILNLARIAQGSNSVYYHYGLKPWDQAARLLVEEAGGVVKDLNGEDSTILNRGIIAGNPDLVSQMSRITQIHFKKLMEVEK